MGRRASRHPTAEITARGAPGARRNDSMAESLYASELVDRETGIRIGAAERGAKEQGSFAMNRRFLRISTFLIVSMAVPFGAVAAEDPLAGVGQLIFGGKSAEAHAQVEKARQTYVAEGNAAGEAVSYLLLGLIDEALEKASDARSDLELSTAKFTALGDHFGAWMSLWTVAELERKEGRFDASIAAQERSLSLLREASTPNSRFSAESMKALAPR